MIESTKDNYTHIEFIYHHGGKMTVSKSAYELCFKNEIMVCKEYRYLIEDKK